MAPRSSDADWIRHHVPVLALRDQVMFPGLRGKVVLPQKTFDQLRRCMKEPQGRNVRLIGLTAVRPGVNELYEVGTLCKLVSSKSADGRVQLTVEGAARFRAVRFSCMSPLRVMTCQLVADQETAHYPGVEGVGQLASRVQAAMQTLTERRECRRGKLKAKTWQCPASASVLANAVGASLSVLSVEEKQQILECLNVQERLELVLPAVQRECEKQRCAREEAVDSTDSEAEEEEEEISELLQLAHRLADAKLSVEAKRIARREMKRLKPLRPSHAEYSTIYSYLDTLASLPWSQSSPTNVDLALARTVLDAEHFGLETVKTRLLEFLAVQRLGGSDRGPLICLDGPPGIGKTSLGQSVAKATGRAFHRIALGGLRDEAELRGHRRTYIGAAPGAIIQGLQKVGVNNPVFLLDEIDKLTRNAEFNPEAVLLELLDPEQNSAFRDHYVDVSFDMSRVLFICTSNDTSRMDRPLLDRLEVVRLPGYTPEEKLAIARTHLLPKQYRLHGLEGSKPLLRVSDNALVRLISDWTVESGVRSLERQLAALCRWAVLRIQGLDTAADTGEGEGSCKPDEEGCYHILEDHLPRILGPQLYQGLWRELGLESTPGMALGLSGSAALMVEAVALPGTGHLTVTGRLGEVMLESVETALSLLRHLQPGALAWRDLHIHFPAGAVPKEGASAGLAVLLALASLHQGQGLRPNTAACGEVSLRGRVLPVVGIWDLLLAAERAQLEHLVLPEANRHEVEECVDARGAPKLQIHFVKDAREALHFMLQQPEEHVTLDMDGACRLIGHKAVPQSWSRL